MTVKEIQDAVLKLSPEEQREFDAWFAERQADAWDRQIEEDAKAGRLDHLIDEALADHAAGRSKPR
ncbi:MAG: hypothetical protein AAF750_14255 [Planctomycetota bacterium]